MLLGEPVMVKEGNINAFVPKRHNLAAAKTIANAMWTDLVGTEPASAEMPKPNALLGNAYNDDEGSSFDVGLLGGASFDDIVDAWLEETLLDVVGALNGEDREDNRVQLREIADKLKPFTRAIVEQHTTITSGKFEVDKLLGPAKAIFNLLKDPDGAALIVALGTRYRSQLNPNISAKNRIAFWKQQAKDHPQDYSPEDLENMRKGRAQKDANGKSMELHHVDGTQKGGLKKMEFYDHRGGPNYLKNHPWLKNKK